MATAISVDFELSSIPCDFYFYSERAAWGETGGARCQTFYFFLYLADHERDWPQFQVVFLGFTTNTLNV